jgi:hypothetical protein
MEQQDDGHSLAQGQLACGKPLVGFASRQQVRFAIAPKGLAKIVGIAIDSGYTILAHKNPSRFFCNVFFLIPLYRIRVGVPLFCRTHVKYHLTQ